MPLLHGFLTVLFFVIFFLSQIASSESHTEAVLFINCIKYKSQLIIAMATSNCEFSPKYLSCFPVQMKCQTDSVQHKKVYVSECFIGSPVIDLPELQALGQMDISKCCSEAVRLY